MHRFSLLSRRIFLLYRLTDLADTCVDINPSSLEGCNCTSANKLFDSGVISCDDECLEDCGVCEVCYNLRCGEPDESFDLQKCGSYNVEWQVFLVHLVLIMIVLPDY